MQTNHWLPLTEYALRSGMSISTLRRKIKSNSIEYKMEDGRYLIHLDTEEEEAPAPVGFRSSDAPAREERAISPPPLPVATGLQEELRKVREEMQKNKAEGALQWRALEARVAGIAKKLDLYSEQMNELKMLVKIFEERLDGRA